MSFLDPWYAQEMFGFTLPRSFVPKVRESGGRATLWIKLIDDAVVQIAATTDTGWVKAKDIDSLLYMKQHGEYRQHTRHAAGSRAAVLAMLTDFTEEEADLFGEWEYLEVKADQLERDHAVTFMSMKRDGINLAIKYNAGETLTAVGGIVALFPGYGTIIGGVMIVGGVALTAAQKNEIMKRAALKKKRTLLDARLRYLKREITEAEYLAIQQQAFMDEAQEIGAGLAQGSDVLATMQTNLPQRQTGFFNTLRAKPVMGVVALGIGAAAVFVTWTVISSYSEA